MTLTIGVVMDPIAHIKPYKDSTFAMMLEAQARGYKLLYIEVQNLFLEDGVAYALTREVAVTDNNDDWYHFTSDEQRISLGDLSVILMRKDPPFDMSFVYATYVLELAEKQGALVVNKPQSLRDCNEKIFAQWFPQCCPKTLVSSRADLLKAFVEKHGDVIVKPLDGMGGSSIFRLTADSPNINVTLEVMTNHGDIKIMAQKYIPEISAGDKRILMVAGKPIPYALARIPSQGETRGNLAAGGRGEGIALSERDLWICQQVGDELVKRGLYFVGIDVIGDYLTEVNVTSPTCIRELDALFDLNIAAQLWDALEHEIAEGVA